MTKQATIDAIFVSAGLVGIALIVLAAGLRAVTVLGGAQVGTERHQPTLLSAPLARMVEAAQLMESGS